MSTNWHYWYLTSEWSFRTHISNHWVQTLKEAPTCMTSQWRAFIYWGPGLFFPKSFTFSFLQVKLPFLFLGKLPCVTSRFHTLFIFSFFPDTISSMNLETALCGLTHTQISGKWEKMLINTEGIYINIDRSLLHSTKKLPVMVGMAVY